MTLSPNTTRLEMLLDTIREKFETCFEEVVIDDQPLHLLSVNNMRQHLNELIVRRGIKNPLRELPLWAKVWPASLVLGRFIRRLDPQGKSLLEIGAGCGASGLIAARYGPSSVLLTDSNADALLFAEANTLKNGLEKTVKVSCVDIHGGRLEKRFDLILASEILYLEELHHPILKFLQRHLAPGGQAVFCADLARSQKRFFKLAARSFSVREHPVGICSTNAHEQRERRAYMLHFLEPRC